MAPKVSAEEIERVVDAAIAAHPDPTGRLLNIMRDIQSEFRYLPVDALDVLSRKLEVPFGALVGLVGSFADFSIEPVGEHLVMVCDGTACHAAGANNIITALEDALGIACGQTSEDGKFTLRSVFCVGSCSLAPIVIVDTKNFGKVRLSEAAKIPDIVRRNDERNAMAREEEGGS